MCVFDEGIIVLAIVGKAIAVIGELAAGHVAFMIGVAWVPFFTDDALDLVGVVNRIDAPGTPGIDFLSFETMDGAGEYAFGFQFIGGVNNLGQRIHVAKPIREFHFSWRLLRLLIKTPAS